MGWPNNFVQGVYNALGSLIGVYDGVGGQIGLTPTYTWATKPLASAYTGFAFINDVAGGSLWYSNGTRWKPANNHLILYDLAAPVAQTCGTEQIFASCTFPVNMLAIGDKFRIYLTMSKSAAVETATHSFNFGTAGTIADTLLTGGSTTIPGAANLMVGNILEFKVTANNAIQRMGTGLTNGFDGAGTGAITAATTTSNVTTNQMILTFSTLSSAGAETYTMHDFSVELITPAT